MLKSKCKDNVTEKESYLIGEAAPTEAQLPADHRSLPQTEPVRANGPFLSSSRGDDQARTIGHERNQAELNSTQGGGHT